MTPKGPGFPIRKSADQSLFAAPHGLSQRTTSFIACACQGIHQMPFRHLIALIINARSFGKPGRRIRAARVHTQTLHRPGPGESANPPVCEHVALMKRPVTNFIEIYPNRGRLVPRASRGPRTECARPSGKPLLHDVNPCRPQAP